MTYSALPFVVTAFSYLVAGAAVTAFSRNKEQRLYGGICLITSLWQGLWVLGMSNVRPEIALPGFKICYTAILFIPPVFQRFIEEFKKETRSPRQRIVMYGASAVFVLLLWATPWMIDGVYAYRWGASPRAGMIHGLFVLLIGLHLARILKLLMAMRSDAALSELRQRQVKWVLVSTVIYSLGTVDLLACFGVPIFPLSFAFTGVSLGLFGYAMFRHSFLEIATSSENETDKARRESATEEMRRLGMQAAFPLVSQGEVLGYLLLGEKMSEEAYSLEDLRLLRIVANQAALGYQRVRYLELAMHGVRTEMLGEVAGGFAHEIKTPLANISLPAEMTFMDLDDVEKGNRKLEDVLPDLKSRMEDIMSQVQKASEKIEAIRQFSKPGQVKLEPVSMATIIENSLGLLDHLLRTTHILVRIEMPTLSPVRGDAKQLEIVFVNLIKNAAEAMAANPSEALARELSLRAKEDGEWIEIRVKDTGPGIRRTDFGHLFQAYFTTKGREGTGMGLFLAQQVIKAHGGNIDVRSAEGMGTEFIIRLPRFRAQEGIPKAA